MLLHRHWLHGMILLLGAFYAAMGHAQDLPDTIRVPSKAIVFFGPTQDERDSLNRREDSGMEEVMSDFLFYAGKIRPFLDSSAISVHETTARRFVIIAGKPFQYDRTSAGAFIGAILIDKGKPPKILKGVSTDLDYRQACGEYFHLSKRTTKGK